MEKRQFISNSAGLLLGVLAASTSPSRAAAPSEDQIILTITGAIEHSNRGKVDEMSDQLMHKQGVHFERAYQFTLADLAKLPVVTISPTLEYDGHVHRLIGPSLSSVLKIVGIKQADTTKILFHGIDGYSPEISLALAQKYNFILATHLDGKLLSIGGFGPLFALYDADRIPEIAQKRLSQRFSACPWGLYCIEIS
ncbi:hypothetical protein AAKU67_000391 [Oxalobacteraceae bacterium GrIS 2.11]